MHVTFHLKTTELSCLVLSPEGISVPFPAAVSTVTLSLNLLRHQAHSDNASDSVFTVSTSLAPCERPLVITTVCGFCPRSLAHCHPLIVSTCLALDITTPVEFAVTPLRSADFEDVIASATAQCSTVVYTVTRLVTQATGRAGGIKTVVRLTEAWRPLIVQ